MSNGYIGVSPVPLVTQSLKQINVLTDSSIVTIPGGYIPGNLKVYVNGLLIEPTTYVATSGNQIAFGTTIPAGSVIVTTDNRTFSTADTYTKSEIDGMIQGASDVAIGTVRSWTGTRASIQAGNIPMDGQEVSQTLYPQFYAMVASGVFPTVTETVWQSDPTQRASFVLSSATPGSFRLPDYNGKFSGSIGPVFVGGDGGDRLASGVVQEDAMQPITGALAYLYRRSGSDVPTGAFTSSSISSGQVATGSSGSDGTIRTIFNSADSPNARVASRTRPVNTSGVWIIKVANSPSAIAEVDVTALATQVGVAQSLAQTLDSDLGFAYVYPNGGTAQSPATVVSNHRYVEVNPFPGFDVFCRPQIMSAGNWADCWFAPTSNGGYGVTAGLFGTDLIVQTGSAGLDGTSGIVGSLTGINTSVTSAQCRIKVIKLKGAL